MSESPRYPKRLIEVDLPIKEISAHARREKSIRHGHISTLHIWWARRPLAAWRAGFRLTPGNAREYVSGSNPPPNPHRTGVPQGRPSPHGPAGHRDSFVPSSL